MRGSLLLRQIECQNRNKSAKSCSILKDRPGSIGCVLPRIHENDRQGPGRIDAEHSPIWPEDMRLVAIVPRSLGILAKHGIWAYGTVADHPLQRLLPQSGHFRDDRPEQGSHQ